MKLKTKLILILMPLSILSLLTFGNLVYEHLITTFRQEVLAKMHNTLEQTQQTIRAHLYSAHDQLRILATNEMLREYLLTEKTLRYTLLQNNILNLFSSYQRNNTNYKEINLLLPDGSEDSSLKSDKKLDIFKDVPPYFEAIKNAHGVLTELFISEENSFFLLSYKLNIQEEFAIQENNEAASLRGYLNFILQPNFAFNSVMSKRIGKTGHLFLTDKNGKTVFQLPNAKLPLLSVIKQSLNALEKPLNISDNSSSFYIESLRINGNLYLVGYLPNAEVLEAGAFLKEMLFFAALISGILTFVLLYLSMNYFIVKPIYNLSEIAKQLKEGNLSLNISSPSKDEIGYLYSSFDEMVKHLRKVLDEIEHTNATLEIKLKKEPLI
jgi:diguanylate cyclase